MSQTIVVAGHAGTAGTPVTSLANSAYNQKAGNCIVVICQSVPSGIGGASAITDTAGNTFTQIFGSDIADANGGFANAFYCKNCKGNASNVTTWGSPWAGTTYGTFTVYDTSGADLASPLDIALSAVTASTSPAITGITSAIAHEAFISWVSQDQAALASVTVPSSPIAFTENGEGIINAYSCGAYAVVTALQSNITLTWAQSIANGIMMVLSFKQAAPPVTHTSRTRNRVRTRT